MSSLKRAARQGTKFQAPVPTTVGGPGMALRVLPQFLFNRQQRTPQSPPGPFFSDPEAWAILPESGLRVTWFGHASLLLEVDGVTLLVDPVWDKRASPVSWAGPKRFFAPTVSLEQLPPLDAILISHDHYDHLGEQTVRTLAKMYPGVRWIAPLEVGKILASFGVFAPDITELDWTESTPVQGSNGAEVRVTSIPTRHFSGRSMFNRNETLWMGFVLRGAKHTIYHGVDTGLWPGFADIATSYGPFDLTLLEIGAFNELWADIHLGPDGAVEAFQALGGGTLMPIHWGLFDLALHDWRQPIERVTQRADEMGIRLFSPEPGVPTEVKAGPQVRSNWWRAAR